VFTESADSTAAETADESSTVRADGMGAGVGAFMVGILWLMLDKSKSDSHAAGCTGP